MIFKIIICVVFVQYATCRTAKDFREIPETAGRLSQADYPSYNIIAPEGPGTYAFGYEIEDIATGNVQFRDEEKLRSGTVRGSYGVLLPDNTLHITRYIADQLGYRAQSETKKRQTDGPLRLEVQVQPSVVPKPHPIRMQPNQNVQLLNPSSTPNPDPIETVKPQTDPTLAASIYQQHQINLNPTYNPLRDPNVIDPQVANAILQQQFLTSQNPNNFYGFRQNVDGSVSTYTTPSSSQNRPPFFNWFGTNSNSNYQNDQQQGPVLGFLTNLAQNNPLTSFFNGFQTQQNEQAQNPFQSFLSNLNPLNLFSNNNRPQQTSPIQSDYISTMSPSNHYLSNNIDSSVFSNDHFLNPNHFPQNVNLNPGYANPGYANPSFNPGLNNPMQSVNFNPGMGYPTPLYTTNFNPSLSNSNYNPSLQGSYLNQFSTTNRPSSSQQFSTPSNAQPYGSQSFYQNPSSYPIYQNPYQAISPISLTSNPNYNQKRKSSKKKNKNKVDVPETESDWFHDFLDKRKEASLDVSSRKPAKKSSDEDDDSDLDDYFR